MYIKGLLISTIKTFFNKSKKKLIQLPKFNIARYTFENTNKVFLAWCPSCFLKYTGLLCAVYIRFFIGIDFCYSELMYSRTPSYICNILKNVDACWNIMEILSTDLCMIYLQYIFNSNICCVASFDNVSFVIKQRPS